MDAEKELREKISVTYFGLLGHEVAALESMVQRLPDLASDYELREPNRAEQCDVVIVNKDSELAISWWTSYKQRNQSAVPIFLSDHKDAADEGVRCKRPFLPSMLRSALQDIFQSDHVQA